MASSNFPNRPFRLEDTVWLIGQSIENNTSTYRCQAWIRKNSYSPSFSSNTSSFTFFINGTQVAGNAFTYDFRNSDSLLLAQVDVVVPHNPDGTKPRVDIDVFANVAVLGYTEVHSYVAPPTIPRASSFSLSPSIHDNRPDRVTTIGINRASTGFTHNIKAAFGEWSAWIANGVTDKFEWTPPYELLNEIPNADTGVGTIWVDTFNGGTYIGTTSQPWRLNVPDTVKPTVTQIVAADLNPDVVSIVGKFVQGLSRAKLTVTGAGVYGSTITAAEATLLGSTVASGGDVALTQAGTLQAVGKVTDSRGRTGSANGTLAVLPYVPPSVSAYQARRCTSAGAVQDDGAYLRVDLTAAISSLINTTERNALTIRAFTRPRGTGPWTARNVVTPAGMTYNTWFLVSGGGIFTTTGSWDVRVEVSDKFGKYIADTTVSTISVTMDLNGKNLGVGKIWENGTLDVAGDTYTSGEFRHRGGYPVEPVGIVAAFAGSAAPAGWLLCDGSAVSRTTYAALFAVLGSTYGAGNGTSTFNLPDLRGRVPVGRDAAQTEFDVLGEKGGAKTHTLTESEAPFKPTGAEVQGYGLSGSPNFTDRVAVTRGGSPAAAHPNLQPYLVLNHIIKAL